MNRGRPPAPKSRILWGVYFVSITIVVFGAAVASSAPEKVAPTPAYKVTNSIQPTDSTTLTVIPSPTIVLTASGIPSLIPTYTPTRHLSPQGECQPQPVPTNMPCQYEAVTPDTDSPYEIAQYFFGNETELVKKYASAIYELLRSKGGYYGGTTDGSASLSRRGWVIVPSLNEVRDFEYYHEYLQYELCNDDGIRPCLYVVSDITEIDRVNDYESIALFFGNTPECIRLANKVVFRASVNYPDQVLIIEDGVVLVIPVALTDCES